PPRPGSPAPRRTGAAGGCPRGRGAESNTRPRGGGSPPPAARVSNPPATATSRPSAATPAASAGRGRSGPVLHADSRASGGDGDRQASAAATATPTTARTASERDTPPWRPFPPSRRPAPADRGRD